MAEQQGGSVGFSSMDPSMAAGDVKPPSWKKTLLGLIPIAGPMMLSHQQQQYHSDIAKKEQQVAQNNMRMQYFATMASDPSLSDDLRGQARERYLEHLDFLTDPGNYSKPLPPDIAKKSDASSGAINAWKAMRSMQAAGQMPPDFRQPTWNMPQMGGQPGPQVPASLAVPSQPLSIAPPPGVPQASPGVPGMRPQGAGPAEVPATDLTPPPSPEGQALARFPQYQDVLGTEIAQPYIPDLVSGNPYRQSRAEAALQGIRQAGTGIELKRNLFKAQFGIDMEKADPRFVADWVADKPAQYPILKPGEVSPSPVPGGAPLQGAARLEKTAPGETLTLVPPPGQGAPSQSSPQSTTLVQGGPKLSDEQQAANAAFAAKHNLKETPAEKYAEAMSEYKSGSMTPEQIANYASIEAMRASMEALRKTEQTKAAMEVANFNATHSPQAITNLTNMVMGNPDTFHELPPDVKGLVNQELIKQGYNGGPKRLDGATLTAESNSQLALANIARVRTLMNDPVIANNLGPIVGRLGNLEQNIGDSIRGLSDADKQKIQEFRTSLNYLYFQEGKSIFGGRPPQQLMKEFEKTSANTKMVPSLLKGSLNGAENAAKQSINRANNLRWGSKVPPQTPMNQSAAAGQASGGLTPPPGASGKTATKAHVATYAKQNGISEAEATKDFTSKGYTITQ